MGGGRSCRRRAGRQTHRVTAEQSMWGGREETSPQPAKAAVGTRPGVMRSQEAAVAQEGRGS